MDGVTDRQTAARSRFASFFLNRDGPPSRRAPRDARSSSLERQSALDCASFRLERVAAAMLLAR
jgi:hypothetical protein